MNEPRWLNTAILAAIHADLVREHGGTAGIRDQGLLESAVDRPRNQWHYGGVTDLIELAAAYGYGLARNHPFVDGNKRVAFQAMYVFLALNGLEFDAAEAAVVVNIMALAAGHLDEPALVAWLRDHTV